MLDPAAYQQLEQPVNHLFPMEISYCVHKGYRSCFLFINFFLYQIIYFPYP